MTAVFRSGLLAETPQTNGITRLMAKVLLKGTKTRAAEQIANQIEAVGGSIGSDAGNNSFSVSLHLTKPDLKLGVDLLSDVLRNAIMPAKAVAREQEVQIAGIKEEDEQLTAVARNILRAALFAHHPYALRANGSPDSVQRLTQEAPRPEQWTKLLGSLVAKSPTDEGPQSDTLPSREHDRPQGPSSLRRLLALPTAPYLA